MKKIEITEEVINNVKAMGAEATLNWFFGVMVIFKTMYNRDKVFLEKYNKFKTLVKNCKRAEKEKKTDTEEYINNLAEVEPAMKDLLGYIQLKQRGYKPPVDT